MPAKLPGPRGLGTVGNKETRMQRRTLLGLAALPLAACSIQPLKPLPRQALGTQAQLPAWREPIAGQSWTYRVLNMYNGEWVDTVQETVAALSPTTVVRRHSARHGALQDEVQSRWGQILQDPAWDRPVVYQQPLPLWPESLSPGNRVTASTRYRPLGASYSMWISVQTRVVALERLEMAGKVHDTARIQRFIRLEHEDSSRLNYTRSDTLWLSPEIGRWVARETNGEYWRAGPRAVQFREDHFRWQLESWQA